MASAKIAAVILILVSTSGLVYYLTYKPVEIEPDTFTRDLIERTFETRDKIAFVLDPIAPTSIKFTFESKEEAEKALAEKQQEAIQNNQTEIKYELVQTADSKFELKPVSYGFTDVYKKDLPQGTYQIGNKITISGVITLIDPETCKVVDGTTVCDILRPPIYDYLLEISCDFRDFCSIIPISITSKTETDGSFYYPFTTNQKWTEGDYLASISATSKVIDPKTQRPYKLYLEYPFKLVN